MMRAVLKHYIMAIIRSMGVGKARNSAGNLTYQTIKGRTIAREKPVFVRDPKTQAQLAQREKMRNVVEAWRYGYRQFKPMFTVIDRYGSEYNQFVKDNIHMGTDAWVDHVNLRLEYRVGTVIGKGIIPQELFPITVTEFGTEIDAPSDFVAQYIQEGTVIVVAGRENIDEPNLSIDTHTLSAEEADTLIADGLEIPINLQVGVGGFYTPKLKVSTSLRLM